MLHVVIKHEMHILAAGFILILVLDALLSVVRPGCNRLIDWKTTKAFFCATGQIIETNVSCCVLFLSLNCVSKLLFCCAITVIFVSGDPKSTAVKFN